MISNLNTHKCPLKVGYSEKQLQAPNHVNMCFLWRLNAMLNTPKWCQRSLVYQHSWRVPPKNSGSADFEDAWCHHHLFGFRKPQKWAPQTQLLQADIQNHNHLQSRFGKLVYLFAEWCFTASKLSLLACFTFMTTIPRVVVVISTILTVTGVVFVIVRYQVLVGNVGWASRGIQRFQMQQPHPVLQGESIMGSDEVDRMVRFSSIVLEKIRAATNPSRMTPSL